MLHSLNFFFSSTIPCDTEIDLQRSARDQLVSVTCTTAWLLFIEQIETDILIKGLLMTDRWCLRLRVIAIRVRVTDRHCRHLRRKIKFSTKNHKLAKTSGDKKHRLNYLLLSHIIVARVYRTFLDCIIRQLTTQLIWIWWKRYKVMCRDGQFDSSTANFPRLSSSIFMTLCRNYQSGINVRVASPTSRKFTQNVITWNPLSNTKMENNLITREIIIVINRFSLLKR